MSDAVVESILGRSQSATNLAVANIDARPDEAAEALHLERISGYPATTIEPDLEVVKAQQKAKYAADIVKNNPYISDYVSSHPLASKVSNDDYANLDQISQSATKLGQQSILGAATKAFKEGAGEDPIGSWMMKGASQEQLEGIMRNPIARLGWAALTTLQSPIEVPMRVIAGAVTGFAGGAAEMSRQAGYEEIARRFELGAQAALDPALFVSLQGIPNPLGFFGGKYNAKLGEMMEAVKPYVENGIEPPVGIHPDIDRIHIEQSKQDLKNFDELTRDAQKSLTKVRSPELFESYMKQHFQDTNIGISGEKIAELYKDKEPTPGDNLLGWVHDIAEQLRVARETGGDVQVPLAEWLARIEPDLAKELHDDIRVRPNGLTKNESSVVSEMAMVEAYHGSPYQFEAFKNEAIGTGEGAQAYGHGHYVAESKGAAENYKNAGQQRRVSGPNQESFYHVRDLETGEVDSSTRYASREEAQKAIDSSSNLYRVRINAEKEHFLDWDKPLEEQHPKVQEAVGKYGIKSTDKLGEAPDYLAQATGIKDYKHTGYSIYEAMKLEAGRRKQTDFQREKFGDSHAIFKGTSEEASKLLHEAGIPGIKYLDQGSRGAASVAKVDIPIYEEGIRADEERIAQINKEASERPLGRTVRDDNEIAGLETDIQNLRIALEQARLKAAEQTYNYVIFDPSIIQILDRNGEAINSIRTEAALDPLLQRQAEGWSKQDFVKAAKLMETERRTIGKDSEVMVPKSGWFPYEQKAIDAANEVLDKLLPQREGFESVPARSVKIQDVNAIGAYVSYNDRVPVIAYLVNPDTAVSTVRHEAIHFLRNQGFFTREEWTALKDAAFYNDWIEKHDIKERYKGKSAAAMIEEAVAEEFKVWRHDPIEEGLVNRIFAKLSRLADSVRDAVTKAMGGQVSANDIFKRVESGEIGSRKGTKPIDPRSFAEMEETEKSLFAKANAIGMTVDQYKRYMKLIAERNAEDMEAQFKRAQELEKKHQTAEWKENLSRVTEEARKDVESRPDIAAGRFFIEGKIGDQELQPKPRLNSDMLTPEQREALPRNFQSKNGFTPDEIANLFGYQTGQAMLERLIELDKARAGMRYGEYVDSVVKEEANARMERQYGDLSKNILDEAYEHVLSQTQMDLLHEETMALGVQSGAMEKPYTKQDILDWVNNSFADLPMATVKTDKFIKEAGKAGKAAEMALLKGEATEAFRQKQRQYLAFALGNEAKKLEKERKQFDKIAKRFSLREVAGIPQEYTNFMHDILIKVGEPVKRSVQDLEGEIVASGFKDLESFVASKEGDLREMPVADFLFDPRWKKTIDEMSTQDFRAVHDSLKTIAKNGRDELKIVKAGDEADLKIVKDKMIEQLKEFKERPIPPSKPSTKVEKIKHVLRTYVASHIQIESLLNRWDRGDPRGVFTQYVSRELATSANYEAALERKYSRKLSAIADKADLSERIENNLFKEPDSVSAITPNGVPIPMTRKHLRAVIQNMGNDSNFDKLARGYYQDLKPTKEGLASFKAMIKSWADQHATKEDWDWAVGQGKIYGEIKAEADVMYRNLTGVAPESLELRSIDTPHGKLEGWYHPIDYHYAWEGTSKKLMGKDPLEQEGYYRATTPRGYTRSRTGYAAPLSLDLDTNPQHMKQMIHDIAFRPTIIQASKIFYDKDIRAAIGKHYGLEYRDLLTPYLRDVANSANFSSEAQRVGTKVLEYMRQNTIAALIGFNPGTVMKHGPTAAINSLTEVGPINFLREVSDLMLNPVGNQNWKFAMETSEELQRRHRHYVETFRGAQEDVLRERTLREAAIAWGAYPVAFSDLLSAVPTWTAQFKASIREGASHGDAVFAADRAVRRAHGSSVITNRPAVMRTNPLGSWLASLYGFFSHILNRQYEMMWHASDALGLVKQGEFKEAASKIPRLSAEVFSYVLFPALIEELVTPITTDDHASWGKKAGLALARGLSASWIGIRDVAHAMVTGHDPSVGLISSASQSVTSLVRDLKKDHPLGRENAGNVLQHGITAFGVATGLTNAQEGKVAKFLYNYNKGIEHPRVAGDWWRGLRTGTTKEPKRH